MSQKTKKTKQTILLGAALSPFVLLISTTMAVKGLATPPALQMDMTENSKAWHNFANDVLDNSHSAQSLVDTLAPLENTLCTMADLEEKNGVLTGSPGVGAVSAAYVSSCSAVQEITRSLRETVEKQAERESEVSNLVDELRAIPREQSLPIFERQSAYRDASARLSLSLGEGESDALEAQVRAQLAVLSGIVAPLEEDDGAFNRKQQSAISGLKAQLANIEGIVSDFLDSEHNSAAQEQPDGLLTSGKAIMLYWGRLLPQIMLAIGVDLAILWMAAFLAASRAGLRELEADLMNKPHWLSVSDLPPWPEATPQEEAALKTQGDA